MDDQDDRNGGSGGKGSTRLFELGFCAINSGIGYLSFLSFDNRYITLHKNYHATLPEGHHITGDAVTILDRIFHPGLTLMADNSISRKA
jgi:hypothetical protein